MCRPSRNGPACCGVSDSVTPASSLAAARSPIRLAIIGCGNPTRSDDGVGIEVIRLLAQSAVPTDVQLVDAGTSGMEVMFKLRGAAQVVVVDACRSGSQAGEIFRLPAREAMTPAQHGYSLHGLRWDHALYAGVKIFGDGFVDHAEAILIEVQTLDYGLSLSPPVQAAAQRVTAILSAMMANHDR